MTSKMMSPKYNLQLKYKKTQNLKAPQMFSTLSTRFSKNSCYRREITVR